MDLDGALRGVAGLNTVLEKKDIELTVTFLESYIPMLKIVKDYEATGAHLLMQPESNSSKSLIAYAASKSEGGKRYGSYKVLTQFIPELINSIYNPHERKVLELIYIDGLTFGEAALSMEEDPAEGLGPIFGGSFAERRRKGLKRIALSLKILGILELIPEDITQLNEVAERFKMGRKSH
ncbi:hypothetical protein [Paenibacillus sp. FSL L8-0708]|uniref:hypothetical protein n=1 Tax=Paenibacillus sp. FSL L8-0708 TaxID=2975311 RepID=UPI0030F50403